ncbi:MAG: DUF4923 family protein [Bacteroidaceae bacterium]|nr:DUF4923 family protein [Bacteroidaceae bacterium]
MKKNFFSACLMAATMLLASCSGSSSSLLSSLGQGLSGSDNSAASAASSTGGLLTSLLGTLLNSSTTLSQNSLVGTWNYTAPDCVFESENFLAQAGGEIAASQVESKLATYLGKVGIKAGSCSYTFNNDGTYSAKLGKYTLSGNYTLDTANKTITMTYLNGMATTQPKVVVNGNSISLLYDADKLMTILNKVSSASSNSTLNTLSSLLSNYNGLLIGMQLQK